MSLEWYDDVLAKVAQPPAWQSAQEQVLVEPYAYLASIPGKEVRSALIAAFNRWMRVPDDDLDIVKKVVGMLHTASLLSVPPRRPRRPPPPAPPTTTT
ncbi:uncharacterized protein JCM10292_004613, partial [Rhodotorula paludigena]|uniref:uncharacterized protein n=1 Tax=Rhodotorula paludigena TaxID=86838 RepID=UPI00317BF992